MIFNFRIVSDEVHNYRREISIDASATFLDLKNAICESNEWDKNQMCSFFLCDKAWNKRKEFTLEDMDTDADVDVWLMEDSVLGDYIEDEGQRLTLVYDYMTDRQLYIEMKKMQPVATLLDPLVSLSMGKAPAQMMDIAEFDAQLAAANAKAAANTPATAGEDMGEEFYGSEQYDEDELNADAFGEVTDYHEDI